MSEEFEMYGGGWRKELMKFRKDQLIDMFKDVCLERDRAKFMTNQVADRAERIRKSLVAKEDEASELRSHLKRIASAHNAVCSDSVYWENDGVPLMETPNKDFEALLNTMNEAEKYLTENGGAVDNGN